MTVLVSVLIVFVFRQINIIEILLSPQTGNATNDTSLDSDEEIRFVNASSFPIDPTLVDQRNETFLYEVNLNRFSPGNTVYFQVSLGVLVKHICFIAIVFSHTV